MGFLSGLASGLPIVGDILNYFGAESDRRSQEAISASDRLLQKEIADRNFKMQEDFAKNGVRWRADDAAAAGLHPLAALGIAPTGSSPVSVMTTGGSGMSSSGNLMRGLASMGQNISRAVNAAATTDERLLNQAQLEKVRAETDYTRQMAAESAKRTAAIGQNPPLPDPNTGVNGDVGSLPGKYQWFRTPSGGMELRYSDPYARSIMSDPWAMHSLSLWNALAGVADKGPEAMINLWRGGDIKRAAKRALFLDR